MILVLSIALFLLVTTTNVSAQEGVIWARQNEGLPLDPVGLKRTGDEANAITAAVESINVEAITPTNDVRRSGFQDEPVDRTQAKSKITQKVEKLKADSKLYKGAKSLGKLKTTKVAGAVSTVGAGMAALTAGYRNGDWKTMVSGALRIASGIAGMLGPAGALVGTVLSIAATIFSFFGGSSNAPKESEEDMIKRVVEAALEESTLNALKAEISGIANLYTTLADSVGHLRKIKEDPDKTIAIAQGNKLYNHAFSELVAFGKLQEVINEFCEAGYLQVNNNNDATIQKENDKVKKYAKRCASFVRLYCSLSIQRQFLLTDMASVVSEIAELEQTSNNFIYIIKKEQERDNDFLRFLSDPINFPNRRYAVYTMFDRTEENALVIAYLKALRGAIPYFPGYYQPPVMACKENKLHGRCIAVKNGQQISESFRSLFVPYGKIVEKITYHYGESRQVTVRLLGASTYHEHVNIAIMYYSTSTDPFVRVWTFSLEIGVPTHGKTTRDAMDEVRICFASEYRPEVFDRRTQLPYRYCRTFSSEVEYHNINRMKWTDVDSVQIPPKHRVTLYTTADEAIRTFDGPDNLYNLCEPNQWKNTPKIRVQITDEQIRQVKVCDAENMQGKCTNIRMRKSMESSFLDVRSEADMNGCNFHRIKSMKIPKGADVTMLDEKKSEHEDNIMGPFVGPTTITKFSNMNDAELATFRYLQLYDHLDRSYEVCTNENDCYRFRVGENEFRGFGHDFDVHKINSCRIPAHSVLRYKENGRPKPIRTKDGPFTFRPSNLELFEVTEKPLDED